MLVFLVSAGIYFGFWAVKYRMPPSQAKLIDLRKSPADQVRYLTFCAGLADNPVGFPGHAYVVWSPTSQVDVMNDFSLSFIPTYFRDQVPSLVSYVPGVVLKNLKGNNRNLDQLSVMVSESDYEETKKLGILFGSSGASFKTGERDCVAFVDLLARKIGMKTPGHNGLFPQDYVRILKEMN